MSVGRKVLSFSCRCSSLLLNYFVATIGFYRRRRLITKIYSVLVSVLHSLVGSFSQVWRNMHRHSSVLLLLTYFFFYFDVSLTLALTHSVYTYVRVGSHQNYNKVGKCNSSCLPKVMILNPDDTESFCASLLFFGWMLLTASLLYIFRFLLPLFFYFLFFFIPVMVFSTIYYSTLSFFRLYRCGSGLAVA